MGQNRSSAVMQQRKEPHDSLDDFPTPPWATRALCEFLLSLRTVGVPFGSCREPAANRGHMVKALLEYFASVEASDVHDYGVGYPVADYLWGLTPAPVDWTITNPPFRLAEQFIHRALESSDIGVAVIVRSAFLEGKGRFEGLFFVTPPSYVLQFSERVVIHRGRLAPEGSSATAYSWIVWLKDEEQPADTRLRWIPPCRKHLERTSDYEEAA